MQNCYYRKIVWYLAVDYIINSQPQGTSQPPPLGGGIAPLEKCMPSPLAPLGIEILRSVSVRP